MTDVVRYSPELDAALQDLRAAKVRAQVLFPQVIATLEQLHAELNEREPRPLYADVPTILPEGWRLRWSSVLGFHLFKEGTSPCIRIHGEWAPQDVGGARTYSAVLLALPALLSKIREQFDTFVEAGTACVLDQPLDA